MSWFRDSRRKSGGTRRCTQKRRGSWYAHYVRRQNDPTVIFQRTEDEPTVDKWPQKSGIFTVTHVGYVDTVTKDEMFRLTEAMRKDRYHRQKALDKLDAKIRAIEERVVA
jgi:hypothetical protein